MGYVLQRVLQRGHLCFHSAIRNPLDGRFLLARGCALGVALASVGLALLFLLPGTSGLDQGLAFRPVANMAGGLVIGIGMVVARSCVSGLSYKLGSGMLSANAIAALNAGAALGGFAHDTGEGGLSKYHRNGGDLVWELGSGYFGARTDDGDFDPVTFSDTAADDQVKMVSLKLSQGAKLGIGGVLPGGKVTREIAEARGVPVGESCVSPSYDRVFSTPCELVLFIARMRELSGGKPAGLKLCLGLRVDFLAICKAMLAEGVTPDFIVVDGGEGGTGAAPLEYEDHIGTPLTEGLMTVHNGLVGAGLRDRVKIGASGKVTSGVDIVKRLIQGADYTNSARDDDGRRLHACPDLSHQHLPGGGGWPPRTPNECGPRRRRQDPARAPLPGPGSSPRPCRQSPRWACTARKSCTPGCCGAASTTSRCSATRSSSLTSSLVSCLVQRRPCTGPGTGAPLTLTSSNPRSRSP